MKVYTDLDTDKKREILDLELEIANCEALASQPDCKKRNTYLYRMWSATHRLLRLTKPDQNEKEYQDKAPYPHLDEEGDDITVGDVVMD